MRNQLKAAIVVEVLVLVVALAFSVAYFAFGMFRTNHAYGLLLLLLWVLVAAVLLAAFRGRSLRREEMVRRFYLSRDWIYNHEIGYASLKQVVPDRDPYEFVVFAADALAKMSYGFEVAQAPDNFEPILLISSREFTFHLIGDDDDPQDKSVVIDTWKGTLQHVSVSSNGTHSYTDVGHYANAKELAKLLEETDVFADEDDK